MIVSRSPLRVTIGGGGTDIKRYYSKYGARLMTIALNKYVYVSINPSFNKKWILKYSGYEIHDKVSNIQHPLIRECIKYVGIKTPLEVTSTADIPSNTGLGSSAAFTLALLKCLYVFKGVYKSSSELAEIACHIEINILKAPIGKQDQYACAVGGITYFRIEETGKVDYTDYNYIQDPFQTLRMSLVYTNITRNANQVLKDHKYTTKDLHKVRMMGVNAIDFFIDYDWEGLGMVFSEQTRLKEIKQGISTRKCTSYALNLNDLYGFKLVGAGGGGFLLTINKDKEPEGCIKDLEVDYSGVMVVYNGLI